jgi:hypothetical protein
MLPAVDMPRAEEMPWQAAEVSWAAVCPTARREGFAYGRSEDSGTVGGIVCESTHPTSVAFLLSRLLDTLALPHPFNSVSKEDARNSFFTAISRLDTPYGIAIRELCGECII